MGASFSRQTKGAFLSKLFEALQSAFPARQEKTKKLHWDGEFPFTNEI